MAGTPRPRAIRLVRQSARHRQKKDTPEATGGVALNRAMLSIGQRQVFAQRKSATKPLRAIAQRHALRFTKQVQRSDQHGRSRVPQPPKKQLVGNAVPAHLSLFIASSRGASTAGNGRLERRRAALRTSAASAPRSASGAAMSAKACERLISHSAPAYAPMLTVGSPFSSRMSVGIETPIRSAQTRCDSFRRARAIAMFSPSLRKLPRAIGGSACAA